MRVRPQLACVAALAFALAACGGSSGPTASIGPGAAETDEGVSTDSPVGTQGTGETGAADTQNPDPVTDDGTGRPVAVTVVLSGTTNSIDGTYTDAATARWCGHRMLSLTDFNQFTFGFPKDSSQAVNDVTFGAEDLAVGASTSSFTISVVVVPREGYSPPAVWADTTPEAASGDSGTANLAELAGTLTLTVDVTNSFGENIRVTATCGPR